MMKKPTIALSSLLGVACLAPQAYSQNSSLFQRPDPMMRQPVSPQGPPNQEGILPLGPAEGNFPNGGYPNGQYPNNPFVQASWTYTPTQTARKLRIHDIVSIRVDELAQTSAQGNASSRKNTIYDAKLSDWVRLDGLSLKPAPQSSGDPKIAGQENEVYRADSTLRTKESLTFNIAAEISDIRPNGTVVLTAQKTITVNDNVFEFSLTGICRADDIGPDNSVLSRNMFDLDVHKNDRGHVRDGYSRGWFTRMLARVKPF